MRIDPVLAVLEPNVVNRFLPLPTFQERDGHFFVYRDETVMEQGCQVGLPSDTHTSTFGPWIISPFLNGIGRRAVQGAYPAPPTTGGTVTGIQLMDGFWNSGNNQKLTSTAGDAFTEGLLGSIACPLLADFWTFCDRADRPVGNGYIALGTNGWQISLTVQTSPQPNFRVLSSGRSAPPTGGAPICLSTGSPGWSTAIGGFTPGSGSNVPNTASGDNSFYWIMIDFLKRQSVLTSGFVDLYNPHRVPNGFADSRLGPFFTNPVTGALELPQNTLPVFTYEFSPPLSELPAGTSVLPQFRAAGNVDPGSGGTFNGPWYWTEWANSASTPANPNSPYPAAIHAQLKPDAINFPLDPLKAGDAHIRKYDDRPVPGGARNFWTYLYNRAVTSYVGDPNGLMSPSFLGQFGSSLEGFTPRNVRYVNWRLVASNNPDADPPVAPSIDTFTFSYRFERH